MRFHPHPLVQCRRLGHLDPSVRIRLHRSPQLVGIDRVEAWGRAGDTPVGGRYGLRKGLRGRFANYVHPVSEVLGLTEVEHDARDNSMRVI